MPSSSRSSSSTETPREVWVSILPPSDGVKGDLGEMGQPYKPRRDLIEIEVSGCRVQPIVRVHHSRGMPSDRGHRMASSPKFILQQD